MKIKKSKQDALRTKSEKDAVSFERSNSFTDETTGTRKFSNLLKRTKSVKEVNNAPQKNPMEKKMHEIEQAKLKITPQTKLFGESLVDIISKKRTIHGIPLPVYDCIAYLNDHALDEEGLYRIPGSKVSVELYKAKYDCGDDVMFDEFEDPTTMVSLVLAFIRESPETVFSRSGYELLQSLRGTEENEIADKLKEGIATFPPENQKLVGEIMWHLHAVSCHRIANKMSAANLAMCIYPTLAGPVRGMIQNCAEIFPLPIIRTSLVSVDEEGNPIVHPLHLQNQEEDNEILKTETDDQEQEKEKEKQEDEQQKQEIAETISTEEIKIIGQTILSDETSVQNIIEEQQMQQQQQQQGEEEKEKESLQITTSNDHQVEKLLSQQEISVISCDIIEVSGDSKKDNPDSTFRLEQPMSAKTNHLNQNENLNREEIQATGGSGVEGVRLSILQRMWRGSKRFLKVVTKSHQSA